MNATRRAVILPVILMVLLLLGLLVAMFSFRVNADLASVQAVAYRFQTRLAAEAAIERVKLLLQDARFDMDRWYHNPEELHRIVLFSPDGDDTVWGRNEENFEEGAVVYRFSVVADDPTNDEDFVRFGITDESAKLNLNTADERQLLVLVRAAAAYNDEIAPEEIVRAILDWADKNHTPRGETGDTEGDYYRRLPKPYRVKNGDFDTVEELLLVKGVTGRILYGEDFDRNGLLTPNEDDGDQSFPPDNQDGALNRGLYPYLTVLSSEENISDDYRPRVYLMADDATLREGLNDVFPDDPEVVNFIVMATRSSQAGDTANNRGKTGAAGQTGPGRNTGGGAGSEGDDLSGGEDAGEGDAGSPETDESDDGAEALGTGDRPEEGGAAVDLGKMTSPASLLRSRTAGGQKFRFNNPLTLEHLPLLLDRTTMRAPDDGASRGLINVNTAPRLVLECLEGLTETQINAIMATREALGSDAKRTPAWLLTEEVLDLDTFERIAGSITARGQQFSIEALGYADHIGMVTRYQVVVDTVKEMMAQTIYLPIVQTIYYRDLTYLGGHYPIREEDLEKSRGR